MGQVSALTVHGVTERLEFSYRLAGTGWSEARISYGQAFADLSASYLSDALGDLLAALMLLNDGATVARVSWEEEPGEFRWIFQRVSDEAIDVVVLWFDDDDGLPDDRGTVVFETRTSSIELTSAIAAGARQLLDEIGEVEYERQWVEHAFPTESLRKLERMPN